MSDPRSEFERIKAQARGGYVPPQPTTLSLRPPSDPERILDYITELNQAIGQAQDIAETIALKDRADAVKWLTRKLGVDRDVRNQASESVIRAERRLGELLLEMQKNKGTQLDGARRLHDATTATYEQLGIEKTAASRWQTIAKLDVDKFEAFIQDTHDSEWELTSGGMLMYARNSLKGNAPVGPRPPDIELDNDVATVLWDLVGDIGARVGRLVIKGWWK